MKIKVVDTPDDLFEYTADVAPRKDEFIYHKDQGYKVSYVCHVIGEVTDTGEVGEVYAVAEVSPAQTYFNQQLKSYHQ
jgi:hypothetical protein